MALYEYQCDKCGHVESEGDEMSATRTDSRERRFPLTPEGYEAAKGWLIAVGEWDSVSTHGFSCDGLSVTEAANVLYAQRKAEDDETRHREVFGYGLERADGGD